MSSRGGIHYRVKPLKKLSSSTTVCGDFTLPPKHEGPSESVLAAQKLFLSLCGLPEMSPRKFGALCDSGLILLFSWNYLLKEGLFPPGFTGYIIIFCFTLQPLRDGWLLCLRVTIRDRPLIGRITTVGTERERGKTPGSSDDSWKKIASILHPQNH